jgi:hypothetical protein
MKMRNEKMLLYKRVNKSNDNVISKLNRLKKVKME